MRFPLFIFTSLLAFVASAQDSTQSRRLFISETQYLLSPALVSQFGNHVVRTDITLLPTQSIENSTLITQSQYAYQTQLGKHHGVGLYHIRNHSNLLSQNQTGLQYGFKTMLAKQGLFRNTQFGVGLGLTLGKEQANHDNFIFLDQLDSSGNIMGTSGESSLADKVYYPIYNFSFNLIGNRAYLLSSVNYMNRISAGLYSSEESRMPIEFTNHLGLRVITYRKFSLWAIGSLSVKQATLNGFWGGTLVFDKSFGYHFKIHTNDIQTLEQQLSYTANRIRTYAAYSLPTRNSDYVQLSSFRIGLALSIVKK